MQFIATLLHNYWFSKIEPGSHIPLFNGGDRVEKRAATVGADERIERCKRRFFDQWLSYQDLIFKCPEILCHGKAKGAEGKEERPTRKEREEWKRFLRVSSGSQAINISCRAGKAGLAIFRRRRRLALSQPLTVAGPNYKSPRLRCEFREYRYGRERENAV